MKEDTKDLGSTLMKESQKAHLLPSTMALRNKNTATLTGSIFELFLLIVSYWTSNSRNVKKKCLFKSLSLWQFLLLLFVTAAWAV